MNQARKRTGTKKVLSMILVLVMLLSLLSMAAFTLPASETGNSKNSYDYNIMFLDCGRKYYSVDSIKQIIDNASAAGFNYIQLAVGNDGLRFLLNDMSLTVNGTTYDSNDVKSAIHAGNEKYYNFDVDELTQSEMDTIIAYAQTKGMGVIPCVNTPGHMDAILSAANSLTGTTCSYSGSVRTIDVTNGTAVAFTKALLQKYITYFAGKGCQYFNMGADEYANDIYTGGSMGFGNLQDTNKYSFYVDYVNKVAAMIKAAKMTPMAFNDGIYFNKNTSGGTFDTDIIICYWSSGWDGYTPMPASDLAGKGFRLINTNGDYYWVLGKPNAQCSATKARGFDKTSFPGGTISNPAGSMFCIWADYPGAETEASVISKTAATIAAFGKALPQIGIKSTSGTALTLNGSTELTVPGNAEATWSVSPAGVIELQSSGNADERSAITGKSVIAKAVGAGTAKVTATVDDKTTYTTTLTVTDPSTVDVTVAVNGTKTITVDGNVSGTLNNEIAKATTAPTTASEKKLELVTAIKSGEQYLIVHQRSGLVLNDAQSDSGLLLNGKKDTSDQLWTITKAGTSNNTYTVKGVNEHFITGIGSGTATLGTSSSNLYLTYNVSGYWDICFAYYNYWGELNYYYLNQYGDAGSTKAAGYTENGAADKGSRWEIYKVTPETKAQTTITFTGKSVGDTSVKIGDVTYKIHVVAEDLSNVTPLTIEYWITNGRVKSDANSSTTEASISATDNGIATETGKNVSELVPSKGIKVGGGREVDYWRCRMLNSETEKQTEDSGDDETVSGIGFTKIRYYGGNWQVFTENNAWVTVDTVKKQLIAYYLENIKVSDEVDSFAADWGNRGDGTKGGWLDENNYCTLSMQVVYEDGTTNPTGTAADDLKTKTIVYGYWNNNNGRGIGTVLLEGQEYEIYKVTSETGAAEASISSSDNITYSAEVNKFTWDKNEKTVWEGDPSSSVSIHNNANEFSSEGVNANLCWDENKEAILLRVYVRAKVTEDSLTVNYFDENNTSLPFYSYNIAVESGTTFSNQFTYVPGSANENGSLSNNTVVNIKGVTQTVNWQLEKMSEIGAQYRFGNYIFTNATKETGNKVVNLYYKFNSEKTFVVDFGLPLHITMTDISPLLNQANVEGVAVGNSLYATVRANDDFSIDYILNKTIDGSDRITVTYTGTKVSGESDSATYNLTIIPATSVYYEDSFATFTNANGEKDHLVPESDNVANGTWMTVTDGITQTDVKQALEALGSQQNVYGCDGAYANSSKFSMGSATKVTVNADTSKLGQSPTATFTFTGTGFDVISLTGNQSGTVMYTVKNTKTGDSSAKIVNTYYGYKYENGKWETTNSADPNALYQIPVIKENLTYGTYEVTISVLYGDYFNSTANKWYTFWLDAIRVYNPMGKDKETYKQDGEGYPQYIKLRDALVDNTAKKDGALFIDGGSTADISVYENYGPNNEVYLAKGQAITFTVPVDANIASIQIGAKAPDGSAAKMNVNGTETNISSATEMYYKIGTEGKNFTIANKGDGILSLTNLKITFKASGNTVTLSAPTAEEQTTAVKSVRALFAAPEQTFEPEHFTATRSRNVRKGGTATLTVKASADVAAIKVNGVTVDSYRTRTERSGWGSSATKETYHVFTYQVKNAAAADYTIYALNADGVASDPIIAPLTVRPSIRDWWNGIFDKWKH